MKKVCTIISVLIVAVVIAFPARIPRLQRQLKKGMSALS